MSRLRRVQDERGFTMVIVICLIALLGTISVTVIDRAQGEATRSRLAVVRDASYQAAEAGIDDYIAKLTEDSLYYSHWVHPAEATRKSGTTTVAGGNAWTGGLSWTYPNGKNAWRSLGNGYEYDIEVTPPTTGGGAVQVLATGRPTGSTDVSRWRVVQAYVRPAAVSDFQMMANADISYGSTATTYGKIYAGQDSSGTKHSVSHSGTAYGDIYAEGSITGSPDMMNGAKKYDKNTIRTVIKNPVNFNDFITSLVDISNAAQAGGVYLNNASVAGWYLTFNSNGTVGVQSCQRVNNNNLAQTQPTCGTTTTYNVPANGAIYSPQSIIVAGQVNGRVTAASNGDVIIGNNITYVQTGDDVLGLVAANTMYVAQWTPNNLSWRAGTIAQSGAWKSWSNDGSHGTMTFTGSTATSDGGSMGMFQTRIYQYDDSLFYLPPPWFPVIEDAYTTLLVRELPAG
ncbi:MAG TPA: hypothetical protein VH306_06105 [Gaiellaceae bacterium]|jgi:Tfp pilus assembly protein PilX